MERKIKPVRLAKIDKPQSQKPVIGVFAPCDPRIDKASRGRAVNIVEHCAKRLSGAILLPDKQPVQIVYSDILIDSEKQADIVAQQFRQANVNILVCLPDTWAFPQLTTISLLQQFPGHTPINITCGNSGPKPGVVYAHALNGAIAQYGRLSSLNVGSWPDTGAKPEMTADTFDALVDWCYAAVTAVGLRGRRTVVFGHDSMGMETALAHVIPTRNTFGIEITRLDMKLLSDMLSRKAYDKKELAGLRKWLNDKVGKRIELKCDADSERLDQSLAMYLICRDLLSELNAVAGGFMSQLEWGSDNRGLPLPVADIMESLFNSTFDHNGEKSVLPFATEADCQAMLTMLFMNWLSGGKPPLFMDLRKIWEPDDIKALAKKLKISLPARAKWVHKGLIDGNNSGSASFNWAGTEKSSVQKLMSRVQMPLADEGYFPGGGNSVTFMTPSGIKALTGRLGYSILTNKFSMMWDTAQTVAVPARLEKAMCNLTNWNWPHTFFVPDYATMTEFKQAAFANHIHMSTGLPPARLQYWMDMTGVFDASNWSARPKYIPGIDRPEPLLYLLNGGEVNCKTIMKLP